MAESGYMIELLTEKGVTPYELGAVSGNIAGVSSINKFGENADVDGAEDIWNYGGSYVFSTSADIAYISSSSILDTQEIEIQGLDENYNYIEQNVTLTGQTQAVLTTPLKRVFRAVNLGETDLSGGVYITTSTNVTAGIPNNSTEIRSYINSDDNQTLMAIYTVPAGKTAYITNFNVTIGRSVTSIAKCQLKIRTENGVFQVKETFDVDSSANSIYQRRYNPYVKVEEKSDILLRVVSVSASNASITGSYDLIITDN
jgi:hypothetical protein